MSTYSINNSTPYVSTFLGDIDPNLFLNKLPNNTSQLILPENVRDSLFTIWENVTFKIVSSSSSPINYIGMGGDNHLNKYESGQDGLKILLGKSKLSNSDILNNNLIDFNNSDTDVFIYNTKPDSFGGSSSDQQYTKMSFLAGDNVNDLFLTAPYIKSQENIGGTAIDMTIYNPNGKLTIDASEELIIGGPNTKVTLLYGTGSTGMITKPAGNIGDLQINLDDCEFGNIDGSSAGIGDILIMGASNSAYWGNISIGSLFTLNQVLTAGNRTDGKDIIVRENDSIFFGDGVSEGMEMVYNGTYSKISTINNGQFRIVTNFLRLDIPGIAPNKVLKTDGIGFAYWGTQSGESGSLSPSGSIGDLQINSGSILGSVNGLSASVGNSLILGVDNTPYWGNLVAPVPTDINNNISKTIEVTSDDLIGIGNSQSTLQEKISIYVNSLSYMKQDIDSDIWVDYEDVSGIFTREFTDEFQ